MLVLLVLDRGGGPGREVPRDDTAIAALGLLANRCTVFGESFSVPYMRLLMYLTGPPHSGPHQTPYLLSNSSVNSLSTCETLGRLAGE
jgi:hypothetical protein